MSNLHTMNNLLAAINSHPNRDNYTVFETENFLEIRDRNSGYLIEPGYQAFSVTPYKIHYTIRFVDSGRYDFYCEPSYDEDWMDYNRTLEKMAARVLSKQDISDEPYIKISLSSTQRHFIGNRIPSVYKIGAKDEAEMIDNIINIIMY